MTKQNKENGGSAVAQWLTAAALWALAFYGLLGQPARDDVRFARTSYETACR